ncbi:MAG: nucleoside hydrolase-like domain-containing protein [Bacteroidota bacterium]
MKKQRQCFNIPLAILFLLVVPGQFIRAQDKPMVIITQDGEVDDRSSFMRFLLYTPDIDLRGVIATNSKWQRQGHGLEWINEAYRLYGKVRPNLLLHHPDYPSVDYLQSITVLGNENPDHLTGEPPYADSEGAELIIEELLNSGDNLLHINCWGGANTVAHALWKLRKNDPKAFNDKAPNVRVIMISNQDEAGDWMVKNMPEIRVIQNNAFHMTWNYHLPDKPLEHNPYPNLMSKTWLYEHIKTNHGPLGAWYPQDNISEGDTPAYLNFIDNGLKAYEDYSLGGWGGRYAPIRGNYWMDATDDNNRHKTLWRWIPDLQNDFAARMDWCVMTYDEANHPPVIEEVVEAGNVKPGQKVALNATATDPDGDAVFYYWWHYPDPSGMLQPLMIYKESSKQASFVVPEHATKDIHIILEVKDDGKPVLKRYKRLVFTLD